jgi:hypothetical protein
VFVIVLLSCLIKHSLGVDPSISFKGCTNITPRAKSIRRSSYKGEHTEVVDIAAQHEHKVHGVTGSVSGLTISPEPTAMGA